MCIVQSIIGGDEMQERERSIHDARKTVKGAKIMLVLDTSALHFCIHSLNQ